MVKKARIKDLGRRLGARHLLGHQSTTQHLDAALGRTGQSWLSLGLAKENPLCSTQAKARTRPL